MQLNFEDIEQAGEPVALKQLKFTALFLKVWVLTTPSVSFCLPSH